MVPNKKRRYFSEFFLPNLKMIFPVLLLAVAFATFANGQGGPSGAIVGTVMDATGGVLPGATIKIVNQNTGVTERTLVCGDAGDFTATLLPVGTYRVEASRPGFTTAVASGVVVRVTEISSVAMRLRVGAITETIEVTGAQAAVQLGAPTTGQTIQNVDTLPLATRNFLSLLALSAGTTTEMGDTTALGRGQVSVSVNGQRPVNNNYQLEGINANDINLPVFENVALPNPESVQEIKTQTSLYDASQGRNGGGNIQANLKSGTKAFHGDAFEFFRNNSLNANDFFLNRDGQPRPVLRQNQFGFSLGGPIPVGANFFFFTNYQGTRAASGISAGTTINTNIPVLPTNRSAANLQSIFFPNGLPPGSTGLNPAALAFLNLPASKCPGFNDGQFCIPSLSGTPGLNPAGTGVNLANLTRASTGTYSDDQFTVSIDKQLGKSNSISGRWFYSDFESLRPFGTASTLAHPKQFPNSNRFLKLGWTRSMSGTMVNSARFGYNRFTFDQLNEEPITLADIGATRGNSAQFPAAYRINIGGAFQMGTGVNDERGTVNNTFVGADDFSWTIGRHTLRFGGEVDRYQLNRFNNFATRGSVTFGNTPLNFGGAGIPALAGFQNFLLGRITTTQGGSGIFDFAFRATDAAAYIQDDWKIHRRLTLNLGLRWEGISIAHDKRNFLSNFRGLADGTDGPISIVHPEETARVGTPGVTSCTLLDCFRSRNFAPRVGFAWDMFGNQKTALRAGYGLYYMKVSNQSLLQTSGGLPFSQPVSAAALSVTMQNPFPSIRPASDFPLDEEQEIPALVAFNGTTGAPVYNSADGEPFSGFFFFPVRDFRPPYTQQWNLTIQHTLFRNWVVEAGYVGSSSSFLVGPGRPLNPGQICSIAAPCVIPASMGSGVAVPAGTPGTTKNSDGSISITQSTADNINARVPVRYMGLANSRGFFQENGSASNYHSAQLTVSHQWSSGMYFQGAYTYSKSIDNASGSSLQDELNGLLQYGDLFDPRSNRGPSDFDRTHRLTVSYQYELPFARMARVANHGFGKALHGWSIIGATTFQSGTPFNIIDGQALLLQDTDSVNAINFATLASGRSLSDLETTGDVKDRIDNYVNFSALQPAGNCVNNQNVVVPASSPGCTGFAAVGNIGRNRFRGPFQQNWDMSFIKTTKVTEQSKVEFRAEFFNIWNHAAFQSPQAAGTSGFSASLGNYGVVDLAGGDSSILATVNRPRIIQFALKFSF